MFSHISAVEPDPVLHLATEYRESLFPSKVDLGIGSYRDENGNPYIFECVKKAENFIILSDKTYNKEYLPIDGLYSLKKLTSELVFGSEATVINKGIVVSVQTLSGTGALRVAADFIREHYPFRTRLLLSDPTWPNHNGIFTRCNFDIVKYPYWEPSTKKLDICGMLRTLNNSEDGAWVLLHTCGHNPTGLDPTKDEWLQILAVCKKKNLFPIFDAAYLGFVTGSFDEDAWPIREFAKNDINLMVCVSFAKNLGLYSDRIGMLHMVVDHPDEVRTILGNINRICRSSYSSPPSHGAYILEHVLKHSQLEWKLELKKIVERIRLCRQLLFDSLTALKVPGSWDHLLEQKGMFSYTGLSAVQTDFMKKHYGIFMMRTGRISLAGLNGNNCRYVAEAISESFRANV